MAIREEEVEKMNQQRGIVDGWIGTVFGRRRAQQFVGWGRFGVR